MSNFESKIDSTAQFFREVEYLQNYNPDYHLQNSVLILLTVQQSAVSGVLGHPVPFDNGHKS